MQDNSDLIAKKCQLGQILLRIGAISPYELESALKLKNANPEKLLGEIIIELGTVNNMQIIEALDEQKIEKKLIEVLLKSELVTAEQIETALSEQEKTKMTLGKILIKNNLCTPRQIENLLHRENIKMSYYQ